MARTKNRPGTAPVAADGAPDTAPAADVPEADTGPAAAVLTALTALGAVGADGAAVADIARHAGLPAAGTRKALIACEKAGTATRERAARPGKPDTWRPAPAPQDSGDEQPADLDEPEGPGEKPGAATADGTPAPGDEPADPAGTDGTLSPDSGDDGPAEAPEPDETVTPDSAEDSSGAGEDQAGADRPDEPPAEPGPDGDQDAPAPDGGERTADGEPADSAGDPPDPAVIAEASEQALKIAQAVADIGTALVAGQTGGALAAIEAIREPAAQARRVLKAATRKRGPGTARGARAAQPRPGALRELVEAHLYKFPDEEFTPHEIGKVLGRSSGAVANALDRLVEFGVAVLANEKPRRFRLSPDAPGRPGLTDGTREPGDETDPGSGTGPAPEEAAETAPGAGTAPGDDGEPGTGSGAGTTADAA